MSLSNGWASLVISLVMMSIFLLMKTLYGCEERTQNVRRLETKVFSKTQSSPLITISVNATPCL